MENLLPYTFLCLTTFFTLSNPLGTMPLFLSMTQNMTTKQRRGIAMRASLISICILLGFVLSGQLLFTMFGISTNGFRVAAGIIILKIGYDMLQAKYSSVKLNEDEMQAYAKNITITPLAIPMLCGPGAIANGIALMDQANSWIMAAILIGSIIVIYSLVYVILNASIKLVDVLGDTGINVMVRLMGLIIMVIATEMFMSGIKPFFVEMIEAAVK